MKTEAEPTHILFQDGKIIISPNVGIIFDFLIEIEKELQNLLLIDKKNLESQNLNYAPPVRSQLIALFAYLETIFCLYISYQDESSDEKYIRDQAMDGDINKKFIKKMILSQENDFYNKNRKRFGNLNAAKIRNLRNMLNHFYSVGGKINIVPSMQNEKVKKVNDVLRGIGYTFLTVEDIFLLISGAMKNLIQIWSNDFQKDQEMFKRKIQFPKTIVTSHGAVIMREQNIKL